MPLTDEIKVKVCLAGEEGVGKTSLLRRFIYTEFDDRYLTTGRGTNSQGPQGGGETERL